MVTKSNTDIFVNKIQNDQTKTMIWDLFCFRFIFLFYFLFFIFCGGEVEVLYQIMLSDRIILFQFL